MQGVPKVPLPFPGRSPRAIPAEGAGWCSHKYSMGNHLYSPALARDTRGGEEAPKGSPSHHLEKGIDYGWAGSPGRNRAAWEWIRAAKEPRRGTLYFFIFVISLDAISHYASLFHPYIFMEDLQSPSGIHFGCFGWSRLQNLTPLIVRVLRCWGTLNGQTLCQGERAIINVRSWM